MRLGVIARSELLISEFDILQRWLKISKKTEIAIPPRIHGRNERPKPARRFVQEDWQNEEGLPLRMAVEYKSDG